MRLLQLMNKRPAIQLLKAGWCGQRSSGCTLMRCDPEVREKCDAHHKVSEVLKKLLTYYSLAKSGIFLRLKSQP
jgi:hypothetical protein